MDTIPVVAATPTDKTHPLDAGNTTSEHALTKIVVLTTGALAVLSTLTELLGKAQTFFPAEAPSRVGLWIALALAGVGATASIVYTVQRTALKVESIMGADAARAAPAVTPVAAAPVAAPPTAGFSSRSLLLLMAAVIIAILFVAGRAHADEPRFGGCVETTDTCVGPRVSAALMAISLRDGSATTGVQIGLGYGITWHSNAWYQRGLAGYVNLRSTATGQAPVFSIAGTFANYVNVGLGYQVGGAPSAFRDRAVVYIGLGSDLGAAPAVASAR